jgi:hypothetical protein
MRDCCETPRRHFTTDDVKNKDLVLRMLRFEDGVICGPMGNAIFADPSIPHLKSLETYHIFHRITLAEHGFTTEASDVATYRTIFSNYFHSPRDYDKEVINAVCYMRENKCVFYDAPPIALGDLAPDVELLTLSGESTTLHKLIETNPHKYTFVGAFSHS